MPIDEDVKNKKNNWLKEIKINIILKIPNIFYISLYNNFYFFYLKIKGSKNEKINFIRLIKLGIVIFYFNKTNLILIYIKLNLFFYLYLKFII
jgi:hypothetical protein